MNALRIDTLEARYHLPARPAGRPGSQGATQARLDRALAAALESAAAVVQRDRPAEEQVLIRELHVPVRLDLAAGDTALALAWGDAFAAALADVLDGLDGAGEADGVVRYGNRRAVLADCARGVARGDLRRAWAWRQMGLVGEDGERAPAAAALGLARALAADPPAIVGLLAALGGSGAPGKEDLRRLLERWPAAVLRELAELALEAAEAPAGLLEEAPGEGEGSAAEPQRAGAAPEPARRELSLPRLARALDRSRIAPAARDLPAGDLRRALAALVLLESDPSLLRGPTAAVTLAAAEEILARASNLAEPPSAVAPEVRPAGPSAAAPDASLPGNDSTPIAEPGTGWTEWGGLLFLLHLIPGLRLLERDELSGRSLRWILHQLALALLSRAEPTAAPAEDDPAALAFAGLLPGAPPPSMDEPPASPDETAVLAGWAERLLAALAGRLLDDSAGLLARVCRRRARIVADPGWIEVHLSLDDVALDLRRAGLDIDPGWLPWLGAVVRFVYG